MEREKIEKDMISDNIKYLMKKRKMSAQMVAEELGCSSQNVYQTIRRGKWSLRLLKKYADLLGCRVEIVLRDKKTNAIVRGRKNQK